MTIFNGLVLCFICLILLTFACLFLYSEEQYYKFKRESNRYKKLTRDSYINSKRVDILNKQLASMCNTTQLRKLKNQLEREILKMSIYTINYYNPVYKSIRINGDCDITMGDIIIINDNPTEYTVIEKDAYCGDDILRLDKPVKYAADYCMKIN